MTSVRPATPADADTWRELRLALWPDTDDDHRGEVASFFAGEFPRGPWEVLLAEDGRGRVVGFAEVSIRPYAEGCTSARVAYLEGWYVEPVARGTGVGRALVEAAADWGRAQGCTELASDADPENAVGEAAHLAVGFEDAGLVRCFRHDLEPGAGDG